MAHAAYNAAGESIAFSTFHMERTNCMRTENCTVVCDRFAFDQVALNAPSTDAAFSYIDRFAMKVLDCCMGDSPQGACYAQLHLHVRFCLRAWYCQNGTPVSAETCFERCLTFTVPRGVFCCRNFFTKGRVCGIRVCGCGNAPYASICVEVCVSACRRRCACIQIDADDCGCSCNWDCECGCGTSCGSDTSCGCTTTQTCGCTAVTLPYSLACSGSQSTGCNAGAYAYAQDGRGWMLPDGTTYQANLGGDCGGCY